MITPSVSQVTLDVVLPCLNEAAALPWVLSRIPPGARALVVDNGSRDGSPALARSLGARVLSCAQRGYGAACHAGLLAASAEFVAVCDCDGTLDPAQALGFVDDLRNGADLVVARRIAAGRGAYPLGLRIANAELARQVRRRTGARIRDVGPLRVARREALLCLGVEDRRSGYPVETVVRAAAAGWRIVGRDVPYAPRVGRSKVTGTLRGRMQAVRDTRAVLST